MTWDPTVLIVTVVPALAAIILAVGYLARRVIDGAGSQDASIRGAAIIDSSAARKITEALQDMVAAHERQAAAAEAILAEQREKTRAAAAERHAAELDELRRQIDDLKRERARSAPARR